MSRNDDDRLSDVLAAAAKCFQYAGRLNGDDDEMAYDAIVRNLALIGEAVSKLPAELRQTHPETPWSKIVGLRNILIHQYFSADRELVELILTRDLPDLVAVVTELLAT